MTGTVAVTGATGFVGRALVALLAEAGLAARALSRRGPIEAATTIAGGLEDEAALGRLVDGAESVVHLAGLVKSADPAAFMAVNRDGTARLARAMAEGGARLILVSSLAARHPEVSAYGASKAAGERAALDILGQERVTIVRPPAVYGPGDRMTLIIFRQLAGRLLVAPGPRDARFSLIHVDDLAALLRALVLDEGPLPPFLEPDDGRQGGYGWGDLAAIAGRITGRRVRVLRLPTGPLRPLAALCDMLGRGLGLDLPLGIDKLNELAHGHWVAGGPALPRAPARITFEEGCATTLDWYRRAGWL